MGMQENKERDAEEREGRRGVKEEWKKGSRTK